MASRHIGFGGVMGSVYVRERVAALDGLRGWAALAITCLHTSVTLYGARFPEIRETPFLSWLLNGQMAIAVFLVISGYVLTINGWRHNDKTGSTVTLARRYTRLALPILPATSIVFVLMVLGLNANNEVGHLLNDGWLVRYLNFEPNFLDVLVYSFVTSLVWQPEHAYIPFLWTMPYELVGSVIVLTICIFEYRLRRVYTVLLALIGLLLLAHPMGATVPIGALLALLKRDGFLERFRTPPMNVAALVLAPAALIAGGRLQLGAIPVIGNTAIAMVPMASLVVLCVINSTTLARLMSAPVSQFLGRISYPIYLVHFAILIAPLSHLVLRANDAGVLNIWTCLAISVLGIALSIICAVLFMPVERFTAFVGQRIGAAIVTHRSGTVATSRQPD